MDNDINSHPKSLDQRSVLAAVPAVVLSKPADATPKTSANRTISQLD